MPAAVAQFQAWRRVDDLGERRNTHENGVGIWRSVLSDATDWQARRDVEYQRVISLDLRRQLTRLGAEYKFATFEPIQLGDFERSRFNLAAIHVTPGHADHEYFLTKCVGCAECV
jgi:hypothetical protein